MEKATNRHLLISASSLRLSRAAGGIISLDYYTVSDVVIKPNQETQTRETNREQRGDCKAGKCNRTMLRGRTRSVCLCAIKKKKKSNFEKFIEAGFYDELCWS